MSSLLLDEMLTGAIAAQLRARQYDVQAVVDDPALVALPDPEILAAATEAGRCLVTLNIRDFQPLDGQWRGRGRDHGGLLFVSTAAFPQNRSFVGRLVVALAEAIDGKRVPMPGEVGWLA